MKIKIKRVEKDLSLPEYHTDGAVAFDLCTREAKTMLPGEIAMLPSNLIVEVPQEHAEAGQRAKEREPEKINPPTRQ